jgi:hypothetical protein
MDLDPESVHASLFTGDLKINGKRLDGNFLRDHEMCIAVRGEPTEGGADLPVYLSLHQLIIDDKAVGTFK